MLPDWWTNREDWREARKLAARQKATEDLASVFEEPLPLAPPTQELEVAERPRPLEIYEGLGFKVRFYRSSMNEGEFYGIVDFPTRHFDHLSGRDENLARLRLTLVNLGQQNATKADIESAPVKSNSAPVPIDPANLPADAKLADEGPSNRVPAFDVTFHEQ